MPSMGGKSFELDLWRLQQWRFGLREYTLVFPLSLLAYFARLLAAIPYSTKQ